QYLEQNFLRSVAKKLNGNNEPPFRKPKDPFDPMVA
ncbi:unnamed protein product, partial [marine sediment metagenome]